MALPGLLLLFFLFLTLIILIEVNVLEYAYQKMGIDRRVSTSKRSAKLTKNFKKSPQLQSPAR